jgi:hypothetical protein
MAGFLTQGTVRAFLVAEFRRPFRWGAADCCTLAADWIFTATGEDPARAWRGAYDSALGARRLMRRSGGLLGLGRAAMAGWPEFDCAVEAPRDGDVAVVAGAFEARKGAPWLAQAAAIHLGGCWIVRTRRAMIANRPPLIEPIACWRIG